MEQTMHIDVEHLAPVVDRVIPQLGVGAGDASAVDQRIHRRNGQGLGGGLHHAGVLGHVHMHTRHLGTRVGFFELLGSRAHAANVTVPNGDACARGEHALTDGIAQAGGAAGDDRVAACHIVLIHGVLVER